MEPELKDAVLEVTSESVFVRTIPFFAHDLEGNVLDRVNGKGMIDLTRQAELTS